ncbi:MAG: ATP-binding protein [Clostridia bacterium]|nr:istB domain protein ATP-binding protein [Clostridium sp. CAG:571]HJJ06594.1 ATP-binding protein [Clostridiaceae bacterium]HJJ13907.1 ATP-binding protein [Clostridiaceae bacterium]
MNNTNLKKLLNEYERKRIQEENDLQYRKNELYNSYPRLQEIDNELSSLAISTAKELIKKNNKEILNNLNTSIENLKNEKKDLLFSIGKDYSYLTPNYECPLCKDTGYITNNYETKMCNCLKQKLFNIEYNKSNFSNLENQNFSTFDSTVYSSIVDKVKFGSDKSPRENIEIIKQISLNFINNFDDLNEKNLLFTGNTGLGKTFLSSCIANEILKKQKTVLYQTAPIMLDSIIDYRFGKNSTNIYNNILDVDLLIIDDLGTECINNMKFTELFNIINTRLLNQNNKATKTIISTNLSIQNLFNSYDERIVSRLIGNYNICRFYGEDLRFKLRK